MKIKLIKNNSDSLFVFFTWWWCDDNQFKNHYTNKDLLLIRDYTSLNFDFDFSQYKNYELLAYSAWALMSSLIKNKLPEFNHTTAINWNPLLFDEFYWLNSEWVNQMENLNKDNCLQFIREFLLFSDDEMELFLKTPSIRSFESSIQEAKNLRELSKNKIEPISFDKVILSENDKLFNHEAQKEYFKNYVVLKNSAHHSVFLKTNSLDEICKYKNL